MAGGKIGLYIIGGLILVVIVALLFYKINSGIQDRAKNRSRAKTIEKNIKDTKSKT